MKKLDMKSMFFGMVVGAGLLTAVTAVAQSPIKSVSYSDSKVYFYGKEVPLENPLVSVQKEGDSNYQLYMPVRELLEYMNFEVNWDNTNQSINLTMKNSQQNHGGSTKTNSPVESIDKENLDNELIRIMKQTGNWSYVEEYLPQVSEETVKKIVEIYNSKHQNTSEHKKASDYIKK